jgi:predicted lipoprotein with Yx(FWY)xxD motif
MIAATAPKRGAVPQRFGAPLKYGGACQAYAFGVRAGAESPENSVKTRDRLLHAVSEMHITIATAKFKKENTVIRTFLPNTVLIATTALLAACGGGGGSGSVMPTVPATTSPVASTGTLPMRQLNGALAFVNSAGFSVYVFDADLAEPGSSTCNGQVDSTGTACDVAWPPVAPPAGVALTTNFGTIKRTDGRTQLTYTGRPLYLFFGDTAPGQANGNGLNIFGGLWHLSRTLGSSTGTSPNPPTSSY